MTEQKSMVDTLIQNPFGEDVVKNTTLQDVASDFPQEQLDAKRALVDTCCFSGKVSTSARRYFARKTTRTSTCSCKTNR